MINRFNAIHLLQFKLALVILFAAVSSTVYPIPIKLDTTSLTQTETSPNAVIGRKINIGFRKISEGRFSEAIIIAGEISSQSPDNATAKIILGMAYEGLGEVEKAIDSFSKAIEINPRESAPYTHLGQIQLIIKNEPAKAKEYFLKALEINPKDVFANRLLGLASLELNDETSALNYIQKSIELSEKNNDSKKVDPREFVASYYLEKKKYQQAIDICSKIIAEKPDSETARTYIIKAYISNKQTDKAISELESLISQKPNDYVAHLLLSEAYNSKGNDAKVVEYLEKAKTIQPDNQRAYIILGDFYSLKNNYDDAIDQYLQAENIMPKDIDIKAKIALCYQSLKLPEKSLAECQQIRQIGGFILHNELLTAYNYRMQKNYGEAEKVYKEIIGKNDMENKAIIALADLYLETNRPNEALAQYRRVIENKAGGNIEHDAYVKQATILLNMGEKEKVEKIIQEGLGKYPDSYPLRTRLGNIYLAQDKINEAKKLFEDGIKQTPTQALYYHGLGVVNTKEEKFEEAEKNFKQALKLNPESIESIANISLLYWQTNRKDTMFELLKNKIKEYPDKTQLYILIATYCIKDNKKSEAENYLTQGEETGIGNLNDMLVISDFYSREKMRDKAIALLNKLAKKFTESPEPYFRLGMMYEITNDLASALQSYKNGVKISENHPELLNNIAWLLATKEGNLQDAVKYAKKAAGLSPQNPAILDTYGWILYLQENYKEALTTLEKSANIDNKSYITHYHIAKTNIKLKNKDRAIDSLIKCLELAKDIDFPEKQEAQETLNKLRLE